MATGTVFASMAMVVLNATAIQVILPTMARSLVVSPAESVRVMTVYQVALAMALLPCAALGEQLGYKRVFRDGVALFVAASILCLLAPGLGWLIGARFLQGIGGACVMALGVPLLRLMLPRAQVGPAIGWNALVVALASSVGPSLGSLAAAADDWRWLFALQVVLGAAVWLGGAALTPRPGTGAAPDRWSMGLCAGGVAAIFLGLDRLLANPAGGILGVGLGVACIAVLLRRERAASAPLVPVDLLAIAPFQVAATVSTLCFTGVSMALLALPFYLQSSLSIPPGEVGLLITPWPLAVAFVAPWAGRLSARVSTGLLCAVGGAGLAAGLAGLAAGFTGHGHQIPLMGLMLACGLGFGLFQTPNNRLLFLSAPLARIGGAGGVQGAARLLGQTTGTLLMSLLFALMDIDSAARIGFGIASAFALAAALTSLLRLENEASAHR